MSQYRRPAPRQPAYRPPQRPAQPRPAQPRPAPKPRGDGILRRLPDGLWKLALAGAVMIAAAVGLTFLWPNGFNVTEIARAKNAPVSEIHSNGPLRLNELMSRNSGTLADENGQTSDWIEVANTGSAQINLYGYALAKNENAAAVFYFPDYVLEPGQSVVVFADNAAVSDGTLHAPFRLSSKGGSMILFNRKGSAIDAVNYPAMSSDMSYERVETSVWAVTLTPTPGYPNTDEGYALLHAPRTDAGVEITELLAGNSQYAPDDTGAYQDYIELHNTTGSRVDLSGWFVSDNPDRRMKWRIPDGFVLEAGEYRIIYASGLDRTDTDPPHANFGLSSEGETVTLSDNSGRVVDTYEYGILRVNQAALKIGGAWTTGTPSPAAANE